MALEAGSWVPASWVSAENPPPDLQTTAFILCPHKTFSPCVHVKKEISLFLFLLLVRLGPHLMTSLTLITSLNDLSSNTVTLGVIVSTCELGLFIVQSCTHVTMDHSPPGFSVHGILQSRILEWVVISFSRGFSQPRNRTPISCRQILYHLSHQGIEGKGEYSSVHSNMESLLFNTGLRKFPG